MNLAATHPVLVIIIPLVTALLIPVIGRKCKCVGWYMTVAATFLSFISAIAITLRVVDSGPISYHLGGWAPPWGIEYLIDYVNTFVLLVVALIALVVALYAKRSVEKEIEPDKESSFYSIYLLFVMGLMGIVITGDVFNLYVFIEISALAGYALIASGRRRDALIASYNYLILGTIGATFILIGIGYLYMATGTLNMADLSVRLPELYSTNAVRTAFAFFTVGLAIKMALFPLHIWLPNVYTHAPSVVSAVMAATATKVGAYVLIRFMFTVFSVEFVTTTLPVTTILLILASVGIIVGSVIAIAQTNIKRMLAYSSIGQIGYVVLGAAIANKLGMTGALVHVLNHALMKCVLFLVVGAIVYKTGIVNIKDMRGLGKKMPWTMAAFTVAALSMVGFPLTVGFVSKWYLGIGALDAGMWYLIPVILASSMLTAVYFWRLLESIYLIGASKRLEAVSAVAGSGEPPITMLLPTIFLAVLCVVFGVIASIPVGIASKAAAVLLGGGV